MQPLLTSEPTQLGDYRFLARLGRGSMGAVYLARSRGGRVVAVKVVRPDLADDPEFRERFRREVDMARSVGGFWTAAVVDADPNGEQPWLATEYVPGPTLHRAVADHGALPEPTVRSLGAGLAEALGAIHRSGLVHRDLKPANVLLGPDGPRVIDFGISRAMKATALTATGVFLGTPGFFSPEQTLGNEVGPPSDVFSLAAVLVFAATGSSPFGDESTPTMLYRVVHEEADVSGVPDGLRPVLGACLTKDPAQRPSTRELLDQLGGSGPQGNQWLPPAIAAVITEHTTQLQKTTQAPPPAPQAPPARPPQATPPPPPAVPRPATKAFPEPPQRKPSEPVPADVERTGEIKPVSPKRTSQQPTAVPEVRKDEPGPEFNSGGRAAAFTMAAFSAATIYLAMFLVGDGYISSSSSLQIIFEVGVGLLIAGGSLSLLKSLSPDLKLKVNVDGIRVSRAGFAREIPWTKVRRVGICGKGKKTALAVWFVDGSPVPKSTTWHRVRRYHGGARVFPLGATGGWWRRRKESKRLRLALKQYALGKYDSRLL